MAGLFVPLYVFNLRDTNSAAAEFCRIQSLTRHITQSRGTFKPPVCLPLDPEEESADLFLPAFIFSSPLPPLSKKTHEFRPTEPAEAVGSHSLPRRRGPFFLNSYIQGLKQARKYQPASPLLLADWC